MKRLFYIIILLVSLLYLYARYIEPNNLKANEYVINANSIPNTFNNFKIIQFSDLLYNNNYNEKKLDNLINKINDYNPDIVIFNGNLSDSEYTITDNDQKLLEEKLSNINSNIYKIAIYGKNDESYANTYQEIMNNSNFIILNNSSKYVFYKSNYPIEFTNIKDFNNIDSALLVDENISPCFYIFLLQQPDDIEQILTTNLNVDLLMSGYSLGGIINIPFVGPIIKKDGAKTYLNGYYKVDSYNLYVNNGIGTNKYKIRLFNTPSINVYRLKTD
jgi:predicted MPP superfamily phosphohydrolase